MNAFINGATAMACLAIGLFFLRFWQSTHDRFFAMFAIAFWILALDRVVVELARQSETSSPAAYLGRLAAYVMIIGAIVVKNRKKSS